MTLLYAFVARGSVILSEYAQCGGNFAQVALDCLEKMSSAESKFSVKAQEHLLNFSKDGDYTYLVVSEDACPREICFYFLEQV
jgi:vesicle-associated membrane protein 72